MLTEPETYTKIDLLRHGELQTPGLFCADPEQTLSHKGFRQLSEATGQGKWDVVICSPARRCYDFALKLAQQQSCPLEKIADLREMDFGRWVNKPYRKVWEDDRSLLERLWKHPLGFSAPEGESMQHFIQRVESAWQQLLHAYTGQSLLLLTHAGVIRVILANALQIPYQRTQCFEIEYAHFSRLRHYPDGVFSLRAHGVNKLDRHE